MGYLLRSQGTGRLGPASNLRASTQDGGKHEIGGHQVSFSDSELLNKLSLHLSKRRVTLPRMV